MAYRRPTNKRLLSKTAKLDLLKAYTIHYQQVAATDPAALNRKVPRDAFEGLLDRIGEIIVQESESLAISPGVVREFLDANRLPANLAPLLPDAFRVFCLALNSLKQWVVAEQGATDRYLLGGHARQLCREAGGTCVVTGEPLASKVELHHPVRDGRPPIALTKRGHATIEGQTLKSGHDAMEEALISLRRKRNRSWAHLRRGCLDLIGTPVPWESKGSTADARTFARKAAEATGWRYADILLWLDGKGL
jgi:hypothetical protein